jgi:hypothetical protein
VYRYIDIVKSTSLISSIITINKNKTATAPIYTIINNIAKYSAPNKIKKPAILKKTKIKLKIECIGFLEITTNNEKIIDNKDNT